MSTRWIPVPSFGDALFSVIETVGGLWVLAGYDDPDSIVEDRMYLIDPSSRGTCSERTILTGSTGDAWQVAEAGGYLWTFNQ